MEVPLTTVSLGEAQYRQVDNDSDFYFAYGNQKKRNNVVGRISSASYHICGAVLAISTFCLIFLVIKSGMLPEDLSTTNRLHLQVYKRPFIDPNDKFNVELGIRLKPNSAPCTENMCWEEREGLEGLVVHLNRGKKVRLKVENLLDEPTMLHWHGLVVPFSQDGVPGVTGQAINENGGIALYDFNILHPGTFFMHSHFKWQHQQRLGTFFLALDGEDVDEEALKDGPDATKKRDVLLFLEDAMSRHPECSIGNIKYCPNNQAVDLKDIPYKFVENDFDKTNPCMCPVFLGTYGSKQCSCNGIPKKGVMCAAAKCNEMASNKCKQCPSVSNADLSNTEDEAFNMCRYEESQLPSLKWLHAKFGTFWGSYDRLLANGRTLKDPQVIQVNENDDVTLRIISSAGSVCFWVYTPVPAEVKSVDGVNVKEGVSERQFPVCPGQRIDVRFIVPSSPPVSSNNDYELPLYTYYPILAQWQGERNRTGIILKAKRKTNNNNNNGGKNDFKIPSELAETKSPLIYYDLERQLKAKYDDVSKISYTADEIEDTIPMNLTSGWIHTFSLNHKLWDLAKFKKDGMVATNPKPVLVKKNAKYCMKIQNNGHTGHPMHLHGHSFQVVELDGEKIENGPIRDTIQIPPRCHTAKICFKANNPGKWLFHCHMIEHVEHGMATSIEYQV
jgi:FtsP/CotA-like multicopper oxidase with cupredoxin domain